MHFADLIAPLSGEHFKADYFDRRPLHIPANDSGPKRNLIDWARMNDLLSIRSHWTAENIILIMNSRPVGSTLYLDSVDTPTGTKIRANPAKVQVFLDMGASLVANSVEEISPQIWELTASIGDEFSARVGANIYCSFKGIKAFASHCDLHEVFALQCEGEKSWKIYSNRAASPVETLSGDDSQAMIDAAKGPVALEVRMRPGDVLYIPRGYYHDALTDEGASLHVTFSVAPLTGRILFRMLEEEAIAQEAFRRYLPDSHADGGHALREHLTLLSERLSEIVRAPRFAAQVGIRQRSLWDPCFEPKLPHRAPLRFYARSNVEAEFRTDERETTLVGGGGTLQLGRLGGAAEWILSRPAFSVQELFAHFRQIEEEELERLVKDLERLKLFFPYVPSL